MLGCLLRDKKAISFLNRRLFSVDARSSARTFSATFVSSGPTPPRTRPAPPSPRSEEHTSELQSLRHLVCRLLLEKKKTNKKNHTNDSIHTAPTTLIYRCTD